MEVRSADVGVDLGAQPFADSDRAEVMMDVVWDDRLAAGDESADFFGREAFVFGDLKNPATQVSRLADSDRGYLVLKEVGTRPAITYLADLRNPAMEEEGHES